MKNSVYGELIFNTGWKTAVDMPMFGKIVNVTVKLKAYYEKDGVTAEQEKAISDFEATKVQKLAIIEKLLNDCANGNAAERFKAKTLLFERDGSCALLCDDEENEDDGVAVCLVPVEEVMSQDEYL
ncbi:MAG: hypothetical protein LBK56_04615 [Gracilibacteraceae bacterium]|jgi:hypothetical protein|nr:hypothetical protein [Gracilibacteraceae bacterium]